MNQDWRRFFDIPRVAWAGAARLRPERGLVCTDVSGQRQLHSWNVETNELRQLTNVAHGVATGTLSPDGRHVYWANDVDGKEKGHLVRVRWEGGDVEQVDQEAKPFAVPAFILPDVTGTRIAFIVAEPDGSRVELLPLSPEGDLGEQRTVWRSRALIRRVLCSADGALVAVRHNESTQGLHEFDLRDRHDDRQKGRRFRGRRRCHGLADAVGTRSRRSPPAGRYQHEWPRASDLALAAER